MRREAQALAPAEGDAARPIGESKLIAGDLGLYYGTLFLPRPQRAAAVALYALWLELREINDECSDAEIARVKIAWWRDEIDAMIADSARHPLARALAPITARHHFTVADFSDILDALAQHAGTRAYATYAQLREYGSRTRGRVESLALRILNDGAEPRTADFVVALGASLELLVLLQGVGTDVRRARVYLPEEDLARFGVAADDLHPGRNAERVNALIAFAATRLLENIAGADATLPAAAHTPLLAAATIARAELQRIIERPERLLRQRAQLAPLRLLWTAWRTTRRAHRGRAA